eukprot:TRINITY_DN1124_c2_g1_i1.p1 TRINITY_DN1124_c2_g1~~TRINITY_DN1124_c2_g1_i1.p1  ORF type:complete len:134 (+),score=15.02 TRINITY_DN1124_c2_g1_i1:592-993(+)
MLLLLFQLLSCSGFLVVSVDQLGYLIGKKLTALPPPSFVPSAFHCLCLGTTTMSKGDDDDDGAMNDDWFVLFGFSFILPPPPSFSLCFEQVFVCLMSRMCVLVWHRLLLDHSFLIFHILMDFPFASCTGFFRF